MKKSTRTKYIFEYLVATLILSLWSPVQPFCLYRKRPSPARLLPHLHLQFITIRACIAFVSRPFCTVPLSLAHVPRSLAPSGRSQHSTGISSLSPAPKGWSRTMRAMANKQRARSMSKPELSWAKAKMSESKSKRMQCFAKCWLMHN